MIKETLRAEKKLVLSASIGEGNKIKTGCSWNVCRRFAFGFFLVSLKQLKQLYYCTPQFLSYAVTKLN